MEQTLIRTDYHEAVAVLTFASPERRNALSPEMRVAFLKAMKEIGAHDGVRAAILTGEGPAFCAGAALDRLDGASADEWHAVMDSFGAIATAVVELPKPVIAAVEGAAFGAGFSLALACDHIVVSKNATFCAAFGRVGLIADTAMHWSLTQRVGAARARSLVMFADVLNAEQAYAMGVADTLCEQGEALSTALGKAKHLAQMAPGALAATKRLFASMPLTMSAALTHEAEEQVNLLMSDDFREGAAAFFEKRRAVFRGR